MKIAVIGAGAMGSLFGALLAEGGNEVWLLDVWADHVRAINDRGLSIERDGAGRTVAVRATTDAAAVGAAELVIVFVKAAHTEDAARRARPLLGEWGVVLTLQNGMGNAERLAECIPIDHILAGTTAHGATVLGPGRIRHAGTGPTVLGAWGSGAEARERATQVAACFRAAGIETTCTDDPLQALWEKLLVNVGINAITALTGIKNGQLLDLEVTQALVTAAVSEAVEVARINGVRVRDDAAEHVLAVAEATAANRSSMGQDVDQRRATEIGAINGAVVREARRAGVAAPINETLAALVETLQAHYP